MQVTAARYGINPFTQEPLPVRGDESDFGSVFSTTGNAEQDAETEKFKEAMRNKGFGSPEVQSALAKYEEWLDKNPKADLGTKLMARRAATVLAYWKELSGGGRFVTADSLNRAANNASLPKSVQDAARYFAQPGNFARVDQAGVSVVDPNDGHASKANFDHFLSKLSGAKEKTIASFQNQLDAQIEVDLTANGIKLTDEDRKDILKNPNKYSVEQRALALLELERARDRLKAVIDNGLGARSDSVLDNLRAEIKKLNDDPEVAKKRYQLQRAAAAKVLSSDPELKRVLNDRYDERLSSIRRGDSFKWDKDKSNDENLDLLLKLDGEAHFLADVLGRDVNDLKKHTESSLRSYFEKNPEVKKLAGARYEKRLESIRSGDIPKRDPAKSLDQNVDLLLQSDAEAKLLAAALGREIKELSDATRQGRKSYLEKNADVKQRAEERYASRLARISSGEGFKWDKDKTDQENLDLLLQPDTEAYLLAELLGKDLKKLNEESRKGLASYLKKDPAVRVKIEARYQEKKRLIETGAHIKLEPGADPWRPTAFEFQTEPRADLKAKIDEILKVDGEAFLMAELLGEAELAKLGEAYSAGIKAFLKREPGVRAGLEADFKAKKARIEEGVDLKWDPKKSVPENIKAWISHDKDALNLAQILGYGRAELGFEKGLKKAGNGQYHAAAATFFKDQMASGRRVESLVGSAEEKGIQFAQEVSDFHLALGVGVVTEDDYRRARLEALIRSQPPIDGARVTALFSDAQGNFDRAKAERIYEEIVKESPDALRLQDGTKPTAANFVEFFAETWATIREASKTRGAPGLLDVTRISSDPKLAKWMNKGYGHIGMGVLGGLSGLANLGQGSFAGSDKDMARGIASGVVAISDLLEGYNKVSVSKAREAIEAKLVHEGFDLESEAGKAAFEERWANRPAEVRRAEIRERGFKTGGAAGNFSLGVISFFDANDAFNRGDYVQGALSIGSGVLSVGDAALTLLEVFKPTNKLISGLVGLSGAVGAVYAIGEVVYGWVANGIAEDKAEKEIERTLGKYGLKTAPDEGAQKNAEIAQAKEDARGSGAGVSPGSGPGGGGRIQE